MGLNLGGGVWPGVVLSSMMMARAPQDFAATAPGRGPKY